MSYKTVYKSPAYLDFVGEQYCCITGEYPSDIHHESVTRKYSDGLKKYFDFGAVPLAHRVHLDERHGWGKHEFWSHYAVDPVDVVINLIEEYVMMEPEDMELALEALDMVKRDHQRS